MTVGYSPRRGSNKGSGAAPTPFHHPPRPLPERSRTAPVAVPNIHHAAPPPLPPPRHVDSSHGDLGWHMANAGSPDDLGKSASVRPGSSLLGGGQHSRPGKAYSGPERNIDFARKENPRSAPGPSLLATMKAQQAHQIQQQQQLNSQSLPPQQRRPSESNPRLPDLRLLDYSTYKLQSEKQMGREALEKSSQAYDKQLLSRIGGLQPGSGSNEGSPTTPDSHNTLNRLNGQLLSLSMLKSRAEGGTTPPAAWSPGYSGLNSPLSDSGLDRAPALPSFPRRHNLPHHQLHQTSSATSAPSAMSGLNIQERRTSPSASSDGPQTSKTGQKRRAQSPPNDNVIDPRLPGGGENSWQRGVNSPTQSNARNPPQGRFHQSQTQGASSLSTTASSGPRNSYSSSFSLSNPGTAGTSYSSDSASPSLYPSAADARNQSNLMASYQPAQSGGSGAAQSVQAQSPGMPQQQSPQQQQPLGTPTYIHRKNNSGILRAPGLWICDCCPKKPKKFESEEELRIHEMEKQYICQYCHNRFKNKNEAERHQNSLHLRRHSWSCSALTSIEAAFHSTPVNNLSVQFSRLKNENSGEEDPNSASYQSLHQTATDTCGYCGQEFINPPNWEERVEHLNHVHKFGECNQSKKFFRADHFRQHLKHSHAGTSGKWTNMLENACMKDEPAPQPIAPGMVPGVPNAMPGGIPGIAMVGQQALLAAHQMQQQQQAQQAQQQQQDNSSAPQATMASIISSALSQQSAQDQNSFGSPQPGYGDRSNPYSQAQSQAQQAQQYQQRQET